MGRTLLVSFALLLAPSVALGQSSPPETSVQASAASADPLAKENWPLSMVDRPLGISAGMLQADVTGSATLTKDAAGKPVNLPLAFWYGVTNQLQIGLVHTSGLCVSGKENNCTKVYDDVGANALYSITGRGSSFELGAWTQLNYASFDKGTFNLQLGPAINWVIGGNVAVIALPGVQLGLNKRDEMENKELLAVPVWAYFRAGEHVAPLLYTAIGGPFDGLGDKYRVPVGVGALVGISKTLDVGARFDFSNLLGKRDDSVGAADERALLAWISVRPL